MLVPFVLDVTDRQGNALEGAAIEIRNANDLTPVTVYDKAGTPLPPLTTNADGIATAWILSDVAYEWRATQGDYSSGWLPFMPPGPGPKGEHGEQGPPGESGPRGRGLNPRGAWDSSATYAVDDYVTYGGSTYRAIRDVDSSLPPLVNHPDDPSTERFTTSPMNGTIRDGVGWRYEAYQLDVKSPGDLTFSVAGQLAAVDPTGRLISWHRADGGLLQQSTGTSLNREIPVAGRYYIRLGSNAAGAPDFSLSLAGDAELDGGGAPPPTDATYWEALALRGADGAPGLKGDQGAPGPKGDKGDPGPSGAGVRDRAIIANAPLAAGGSVDFMITPGGRAAIFDIVGTAGYPCRVRLYTTTTKRNADRARPVTQDPPAGEHGLIFEVVLQAYPASSVQFAPAVTAITSDGSYYGIVENTGNAEITPNIGLTYLTLT